MMSFASRDITEIVHGCKGNWPSYLASVLYGVVRDVYYSATVSYPQTPLYSGAGHTPST